MPQVSPRFLTEEDFNNLVHIVTLAHDLGKTTNYFQDKLDGQSPHEKSLADHALLSSLMAFWIIDKHLDRISDKGKAIAKVIGLLAVKRHHSRLENLNSELSFLYVDRTMKNIEKQLNSISEDDFNGLLKLVNLPTSLSYFKEKILDSTLFNDLLWKGEDAIQSADLLELYLLTNLILGLLVDADVRSAAEIEVKKRLEIDSTMAKSYLNSLTRCKKIDNLRDRFFQEVDKVTKGIPLDENILSLNAPTGIGKTLAGFNAALVLRERIHKETGRLPRIIYALPFTSIIDQNYNVFREIFETSGLEPDDYLAKHHHLAEPPGVPENATNEDYEKAATAVETWDSEVVVTTFIQLFGTLFTNRRSDLRKLHRLAGSILILDEVQNIPARYWLATEEMLKELARLFNTKIILMTATKPALFPDARPLLENKETYFKNLNRTTLSIKTEEGVHYTEIEKWLLPEISESKSFLVVMNTIKSSMDVYTELSKVLEKGYILKYLSASLIPKHRQERVAEIKALLKSEKNVGLVSTQAVEAGVDLDFDVVIRDRAPLDSVIQATGRCNRNMSGSEGKVTLVKLQDENHPLSGYIYDPVLLSATDDAFGTSSLLEESYFHNVVESYFKDLRETRISQHKKALEDARKLNYANIAEFKLIKELPIFLDVFVEYDKEASEILTELHRIEGMPTSSRQEKLDKRKEYRRISKKVRFHVVSSPVKVVGSWALEDMPYLSEMKLLSQKHPDFKNIYNDVTGFTRDIGHEHLIL
jgi:CRISPR-associated endonuclease/helicase Cas3